MPPDTVQSTGSAPPERESRALSHQLLPAADCGSCSDWGDARSPRSPRAAAERAQPEHRSARMTRSPLSDIARRGNRARTFGPRPNCNGWNRTPRSRRAATQSASYERSRVCGEVLHLPPILARTRTDSSERRVRLRALARACARALSDNPKGLRWFFNGIVRSLSFSGFFWSGWWRFPAARADRMAVLRRADSAARRKTVRVSRASPECVRAR